MCVCFTLNLSSGIFDIRQCALLQCIPVHNTAVNSIVVNDVDGYFVAGSVGGDIKASPSVAKLLE